MASALNINRLRDDSGARRRLYTKRAVAVGDRRGEGGRGAIHFRSGSEIQPRFFTRKLSKSGSGGVDPSESLNPPRCAAGNDFLRHDETRRDETRRLRSGFSPPRARSKRGREESRPREARFISVPFATGRSILLSNHAPHSRGPLQPSDSETWIREGYVTR